MLQILLVTALCLDAFTASLACGISKTKIRWPAVAVISLLCTSALAVSTGLSSLARGVLSAELSSAVSFALLLVIGLVKSFEFLLKRWISRNENKQNQLRMRVFDLNVVLTVYADADKADLDHSKSISVKEAVYLALALSLDGFAVGFGWGLLPINYLSLTALSLASNVLALTLGYFLGKWLIHKTKLDLSWLGGILLIALAVLKLFKF